VERGGGFVGVRDRDELPPADELGSRDEQLVVLLVLDAELLVAVGGGLLGGLGPGDVLGGVGVGGEVFGAGLDEGSLGEGEAPAPDFGAGRQVRPLGAAQDLVCGGQGAVCGQFLGLGDVGSPDQPPGLDQGADRAGAALLGGLEQGEGAALVPGDVPVPGGGRDAGERLAVGGFFGGHLVVVALVQLEAHLP